MIPAAIKGATRNLGKPKGWDNARDGHCGGLMIRDDITGHVPSMTSAWTPTPDELARLNAGANIELRIVGIVHPPVMISVGDADA